MSCSIVWQTSNKLLPPFAADQYKNFFSLQKYCALIYSFEIQWISSDAVRTISCTGRGHRHSLIETEDLPFLSHHLSCILTKGNDAKLCTVQNYTSYKIMQNAIYIILHFITCPMLYGFIQPTHTQYYPHTKTSVRTELVLSEAGVGVQNTNFEKIQRGYQLCDLS